MTQKHKILVLGASYGSLLGIKLSLAGHDVHLVCLPAEADLVNSEGVVVRMPVKGRNGLVEVRSRGLPGAISASGAKDVDVNRYDLVALAMQEPQYRAADVRALLDAVARAGVPAMSVMNMPPLIYLRRIPGIDVEPCRRCYTDASVWDAFSPQSMTLCSPDPQAFRPPDEKPNVLQVRLPTNFKVARFESEADTAVLRQLSADIDAARFSAGGEAIELPVKLRLHDSVYVPLAKWPMLVAGNYRCVQADGARSIKEAVHADLAVSRAVYDWVVRLCMTLGARENDLVPFDKYANAALSLGSPSSAARALFAGAANIERLDLLVQCIAKQHGLHSQVLDATVALVDAQLQRNRGVGKG